MRSDLFCGYLARDARIREEGRQVLMLMDNVSSHNTDDLTHTNIRVHKIVPNTTLYNQPLNAGIIHAFKAEYARRRDTPATQQIDGVGEPYEADLLTGTCILARGVSAHCAVVSGSSNRKCSCNAVSS